MGFWENRRVVLSGGNGFLGSFVVEKLRAAGCREISTPHSRSTTCAKNRKHCGYIRMRGRTFLFTSQQWWAGSARTARTPGDFSTTTR